MKNNLNKPNRTQMTNNTYKLLFKIYSIDIC